MINRRQWLKFVAGSLVSTLFNLKSTIGGTKPNILFIAVDDLNSWLGCLGHPDAITPNMDRLAERSMLFTHAYTPAPLCNPARSAVMSGLYPATTGMYLNGVPFRNSPVLEKHITLPEYFAANGYTTYGYGKIFHRLQHDAFHHVSYGPFTQDIDIAIEGQPPHNGLPELDYNFDWAMGDFDQPSIDERNLGLAINTLNQAHSQPFFLGVGFVKPHLPWYIPPSYYDLYDQATLNLPTVLEDDLADIPEIAYAETTSHASITKHGKWREGVHAYLAAISFVDAQVSKLLDALDNSAYAQNTIIALWSDHGFLHGQKNHWRKDVLWEEALHIPLMISAPDMQPGVCHQPVSSLHLYPTLADLAGLAIPPNLDGQSLRPLLANPAADWELPVLSTRRYGEHTVRTQAWRYTQYTDDWAELYDHQNDPLEHTNLIHDATYADIVADLQTYLPKENAAPIYKD